MQSGSPMAKGVIPFFFFFFFFYCNWNKFWEGEGILTLFWIKSFSGTETIPNFRLIKNPRVNFVNW